MYMGTHRETYACIQTYNTYRYPCIHALYPTMHTQIIHTHACIHVHTHVQQRGNLRVKSISTSNVDGSNYYSLNYIKYLSILLNFLLYAVYYALHMDEYNL